LIGLSLAANQSTAISTNQKLTGQVTLSNPACSILNATYLPPYHYIK